MASTRVARRAVRKLASSATLAKIKATMRKVVASVGRTRKGSFRSSYRPLIRFSNRCHGTCRCNLRLGQSILRYHRKREA